MTRETIQIYHSCDPPEQQTLCRFKKGVYTPKGQNDPAYPDEAVRIPKANSHGVDFCTTEGLRCKKKNCAFCERTRTHSKYALLAKHPSMRSRHDNLEDDLQIVSPMGIDMKPADRTKVRSWTRSIPTTTDYARLEFAESILDEDPQPARPSTTQSNSGARMPTPPSTNVSSRDSDAALPSQLTQVADGGRNEQPTIMERIISVIYAAGDRKEGEDRAREEMRKRFRLEDMQ